MWGRKEAKKESETVQIINAMTSSMTRLHAAGGLGYGFTGISIIIGGVLSFAGKLIPEIFDMIIVVCVAGVVIASIERYVSVKLATEKLRLISILTQEMVRASIPKQERMDSAHVRELMNEILKEIWKLEIDAKSNERVQ